MSEMETVVTAKCGGEGADQAQAREAHVTSIPGYDAWRTAGPPEPVPDPCAACDGPRTAGDEARGSSLCETCRADDERARWEER